MEIDRFGHVDAEAKILLLVTEKQTNAIRNSYLIPFMNKGIDAIDVGVLYIDPNKKKTSAALMKQFIEEEICPISKRYDYILVADSDYFKCICKVTKSDTFLNYKMKSPLLPNIIYYIPSYKRLFYSPELKETIDSVIKTVADDMKGIYEEPGKNIIKDAVYCFKPNKIRSNILNPLLNEPALTIDIETTSLKFYDGYIKSIAFGINEHSGKATVLYSIQDADTTWNKKRYLYALKHFFKEYQGVCIYHNAAFDITYLIYHLFMRDLNDIDGLLEGLKVMTKNWHDTKLIAYLATNSCSRVSCGLKDLAQSFAGNYAQEEIGDVSKIPEDELLKYNLVDCLSTWFVFNKYYPIMLHDMQKDIYENIFQPATVDIIQMQLTGMPIDIERTKEVWGKLQKDKLEYEAIIQSSPIIQEFKNFLNEKWVERRNKELKVKRVTLDDANEEFNPGSNLQLSELFYEYLGLPVLKKTKLGQPAVDSDALSELLGITDREDVKSLLNAILELSAVQKILTAFLPAFLDSPSVKESKDEKEWNYLFGNFNLGGTVSGRLSSSNINLQNLPATGSKYAKIIKSCFKAPKGKLFIGLDFASLEDRISALTTKDPNKLKVYTDNYDGHCLRTFFYYKNQMPDIAKEYEEAKTEDERVKVINSIKSRYKALRQSSKPITFALTYQGTWHTLMEKCKMPKEEAKRIEKTYHELYSVSDKWVQGRLNQAGKDGYVTGAFGLRVRTPLLQQVLRGIKVTPKEADAEARTAGNALGQSWCLLNSRAASEFMAKVRDSKYATRIRPCAQIHDAQYYLVDDDIDLILWINENLVQAVKWQEHPDIAHDKVKLGGNLSIFYPDWAHEIELPNDITKEQLVEIIREVA